MQHSAGALTSSGHLGAVSVSYQDNGPLIPNSNHQQIEAHTVNNHDVGLDMTQHHPHEAEINHENDKRAIYRHPLFPLMALLFEKCEQATQTQDCPTSDSFDVDIQAFVHHQEQDRKPFLINEPELDNLMIKAIQVLRIHLLELEKVTELCKDFCNRYISCLKGKLQSENLLRTDGLPGFDGDSSPQDFMFNQDSSSPTQLMTNNNTGGTNVVIQTSSPNQTNSSVQSINQGQIVSGGTVYQMVQTPQGLVAQPIQLQSPVQSPPPSNTTQVVHGSTPLSQIGLGGSPTLQNNSFSNNHFLMNQMLDDDDLLDKKKNKRGVLPKQATQVMKSWLFQHIVHPYPTEDEKRQIAAQTNLTLLQVNNWFINARRRILQPMLDASQPADSKTAKKSKPQNRPVQRFWPENLANFQNSPSAPGTPSEPTSPSNPDSPIDENTDSQNDTLTAEESEAFRKARELYQNGGRISDLTEDHVNNNNHNSSENRGSIHE